MNVAIAEDNALMRKALNDFLRSVPGYEVIIESENGIELIKKVQTSRQIPRVAIIDINMPLMDGVSIAHYFRFHHPDIKVLCISALYSEQLVIDVLEAGASGFLKKENLYEQLRDAIQKICGNGIYTDLSIPYRSLPVLPALQSMPDLPFLTPQERLFLLLCATNTTYEDIASIMHVAKQTIYNYQKSLKEKLSISSREGFMIYAIQNGIARIAKISNVPLGRTQAMGPVR